MIEIRDAMLKGLQREMWAIESALGVLEDNPSEELRRKVLGTARRAAQSGQQSVEILASALGVEIGTIDEDIETERSERTESGGVPDCPVCGDPMLSTGTWVDGAWDDAKGGYVCGCGTFDRMRKKR